MPRAEEARVDMPVTGQAPCVLSWDNLTCRVVTAQGKERYILQVRAADGCAVRISSLKLNFAPCPCLPCHSHSLSLDVLQAISGVAGPAEPGVAACMPLGANRSSCLFAILGPSGALAVQCKAEQQ